MLTLLIAGAVAAATRRVRRPGQGGRWRATFRPPSSTFRHGLAEHPGDRELGDLLEAARDLVPYPPVADATERLRPDPPANWDRWVGAWELTAIGRRLLGPRSRSASRPGSPPGPGGRSRSRSSDLLGSRVVAAMTWPRETGGTVAVVRPDKRSRPAIRQRRFVPAADRLPALPAGRK